MVVMVIAYPGLVTSGLGENKKIDLDKIQIDAPTRSYSDESANKGEAAPSTNDDMDAVLRALKSEQKK